MTESNSETPMGRMHAPQLLVSVRSASEANAASAGGCQILDVKEPSLGSLGKADNVVIEQILQAGRSAGIQVSAALGEVTDYSTLQGSDDSDQRLPESLSELSFTKLGLAGLSRDRNWATRWQDTMSLLTDSFAKDSFAKDRPGSLHQWVAVIYADWERAAAPSPDAIVDCVLSSSLSTETGIAGVLVDTWSKDSGRLLDALDVEQLRGLSTAVQRSGRFFAVAGRLTSSMLPALTSVRPDIVAIRSAACRNEDRTSTIDESAVRAFRASIDRTFSSPASEQPLSIGVSLE
jgi:(5-formylfuran-3-yl)methyl phosphate synthase